jgi:hypothetical protein
VGHVRAVVQGLIAPTVSKSLTVGATGGLTSPIALTRNLFSAAALEFELPSEQLLLRSDLKCVKSSMNRSSAKWTLLFIMDELDV